MNTEIFHTRIELQNFWKRQLWIPSRTSGRSTADVEMATMARHVLNNIESPFWDYPVHVTHQDRPDFIVESGIGRIGVEVTEQWSRSYGHALALSENSDGFLEPSDFSFDGGDKKRTGKTLGKLVNKTRFTGPPTMGDHDERRWVSRTLETAERKAAKADRYPQASELDELHLCIFDVRPEFPRFDELTVRHMEPIYDSQISSVFSCVACIDSHVVNIDLKRKNFTVTFNPHSKKKSEASYAEA